MKYLFSIFTQNCIGISVEGFSLTDVWILWLTLWAEKYATYIKRENIRNINKWIIDSPKNYSQWFTNYKYPNFHLLWAQKYTGLNI